MGGWVGDWEREKYESNTVPGINFDGTPTQRDVLVKKDTGRPWHLYSSMSASNWASFKKCRPAVMEHSLAVLRQAFDTDLVRVCWLLTASCVGSGTAAE